MTGHFGLFAAQWLFQAILLKSLTFHVLYLFFLPSLLLLYPIFCSFLSLLPPLPPSPTFPPLSFFSSSFPPSSKVPGRCEVDEAVEEVCWLWPLGPEYCWSGESLPWSSWQLWSLLWSVVLAGGVHFKGYVRLWNGWERRYNSIFSVLTPEDDAPYKLGFWVSNEWGNSNKAPSMHDTKYILQVPQPWNFAK